MNNIHTIPLSSGQPQPQQQQQQVIQTQSSAFSLDAIKEKLFNILPATKIILFLEIGFEVLGLIINEPDAKLAFNSGYFFKNPWTILTSLFYDSSILSVNTSRSFLFCSHPPDSFTFILHSALTDYLERFHPHICRKFL